MTTTIESLIARETILQQAVGRLSKENQRLRQQVNCLVEALRFTALALPREPEMEEPLQRAYEVLKAVQAEMS